MTEADREPFSKAIIAMTLSYGQELEMQRFLAYWEALEDVPFELVHRAIGEAIRRSEFLPTVAVLRKLADVVADQGPDPTLGPPLLAGHVDTAEYEESLRVLYACRECEDTGFVSHQCSPDVPLDERCGRAKCAAGVAPPHHFVTGCLCRSTNPNFLRKIKRKYKHEV